MILPKYFYFNLVGYDIWWHLKASEELYNNFSFPTPDHYSYTANEIEWNQHSWLGAFIYYVFFKKFGRDSLIYLTLSIKIFTVVVTYILAFHKIKSYSLSLLLAYCTAIAITIMVPRPYVFSPLMAILYFYNLTALHEHINSCKKDYFSIRKKGLILFLLSVLWINLHGEFVVGVIMIVSLVLSGFIMKCNRNISYYSQLFKFIVLPSFIGFLFNPHGLWGLLYPLDARKNPSADFAPITFVSHGYNFGPPEIILYSILFFCTLISFNNFFKNDDFERTTFLSNESSFFIILYGSCCLLSMQYIRMSWILIIPIWIVLLCRKKENMSLAKENILAIIILIALIFSFPLRVHNDYPIDTPNKAINFLKETKLTGNLFTLLTWGGIIIHELNPDVKVFIDGRLQIYKGKIYNDYKEILNGQENCVKILESYDTDIVLVPNETFPPIEIIRSDNWTKIFTSPNESIYMRNDSNEKNWELLNDYYRKYEIPCYKGEDFQIADCIVSNPRWVEMKCGIDRKDVRHIYDMVKFLSDPYSSFRPPSRSHAMYELLGEKLFNMGFYEEAETHLRISFEYVDHCDKAEFLLSKALFKLGVTKILKIFIDPPCINNPNSEIYIDNVLKEKSDHE